MWLDKMLGRVTCAGKVTAGNKANNSKARSFKKRLLKREFFKTIAGAKICRKSPNQNLIRRNSPPSASGRHRFPHFFHRIANNILPAAVSKTRDNGLPGRNISWLGNTANLALLLPHLQ